ncbi:galanin peptides [Mirounga leonina]|uniref:galanin peptides n=1 Tax=Mirounga leonina TaxID=9715 RepID=UPI00156C12FE|nr:galanin peptides [Mirounga leonina]XP_045748494.1 galanin peptides [Mirounga angustirostris]
MPGGCALLLAWLLLAAALSATPGLGSPVKEKRGWTLNSAGYLLGPHAIDNHRSFQEKPGLTGKRELPPEDEARPGGFARPLSEKAALRMIIEFLTFLHLKEAGALEYMPELPAAVSAEDQEQA